MLPIELHSELVKEDSFSNREERVEEAAATRIMGEPASSPSRAQQKVVGMPDTVARSGSVPHIFTAMRRSEARPWSPAQL